MFANNTVVKSILFLIFALSCHAEEAAQERTMLRGTNSNNNIGGRPVMHTFYASIDTKSKEEQDADRKLLSAWSSAWQASGWDVRILGMEDAVKHPYYENLDKLITPHVNNEYNKFCFFRWIAMGSLPQGGFISDYDTFPLPSSKPFGDANPNELPNNGRFTVFDGQVRGDVPHGIPSLMSGSRREWNRMITSITKQFKNDPENTELVTTDMLALMALDRSNAADYYEYDQKIVNGLDAIGAGRDWGEKCEEYRGFYAVHFAHTTIRYGIKKGVFPPSTTADDRAMLVSDLIRQWARRCGVVEHQVMDSQSQATDNLYNIANQ